MGDPVNDAEQASVTTEATILGTPPALRADLGEDPTWKLFKLDVFPGREISDADYVWYLDKLRYLLMYQDKPAPLAFSR